MKVTLSIEYEDTLTNGKVIQTVFPDTKIITQYDTPFGQKFIIVKIADKTIEFSLEWWEAEYDDILYKLNKKSKKPKLLECPDCRGQGTVYDYLTGEIKSCELCHGSGVVQCTFLGGKDDTD